MKLILGLMLVLTSSFAFSAGALSPRESLVLKIEGKRLWEGRVQEDSLKEALSKFELALEGDPTDLEVLTYLTRGYFLLADQHQTDKDSKKKSLEKARDYGERGLKMNEEYKHWADKDIEKALSKITEKEVPIAFWTAAALGKWAKLNGIFSSMKYKNQILSSIKQVEKMRPDFYHGAVPRYWGGFYAVAPGIAGGSMKKSKESFQKAIEMAPDYLGTKVLYAELYLVDKKEKKEFQEVLLQVLAAPNGPKEITPENMLEKKKAEKMLEDIEKLF